MLKKILNSLLIIFFVLFFLARPAISDSGFFYVGAGQSVTQPSFCLNKSDYVSTIKLIGILDVDSKEYKRAFLECEAVRVSETTLLQKQIKKETKIHFWNNPEFRMWVGFILGVAVTSLAVEGAAQLHR